MCADLPERIEHSQRLFEMLPQRGDRSYALEEIEGAFRLVRDFRLTRGRRNPDSARNVGRAPRVDEERVQVLDRRDELRPDRQVLMTGSRVKAVHDFLE